MSRCENCIHNKVCDEWAVSSGLPFVNANTCDHYKPAADVAPKSEVAKNVLLELKKQIHDKAVYTNSQDIPNYINLKVFDAILQNYLNNLK